jgi:phospholipid/cholesterol/gamma-HCH transport system permease protein
MGAALVAAIVWQGARPLTWRRPVRAEFIRFMNVAAVQSVATVAIVGIVVGFTLLAQAIFWRSRLGASAQIQGVVMLSLVRTAAPLLVGLIVTGRGGLLMLDELDSARRGGQWRALDAQGVDPFLLLVVPRVFALALSVFCLSAVFVFVALATAYVGAQAMGETTLQPREFVLGAIRAVGTAEFALVPAKTLLIGFAVGSVCALTALGRPAGERRIGRLMSSGFIRSVLAVIVVVGLFTVLA